jgi:hypothetical protein
MPFLARPENLHGSILAFMPLARGFCTQNVPTPYRSCGNEEGDQQDTPRFCQHSCPFPRCRHAPEEPDEPPCTNLSLSSIVSSRQILFTMKTITQMIIIVPTIPYPNIFVSPYVSFCRRDSGMNARFGQFTCRFNLHVHGR